MPIISIKAEPVFEIAGFPITNSLLASVLVIVLFFFLAYKYNEQSQKEKKNGFFYFITMIVKVVYDFFYSVLGDKTDYFFPLIGCFFFYVLFQNWFGLLPGVGSVLVKIVEHGKEMEVPILRGNNADLNATLVLGIVAFVSIQYFGIKFLGFKKYIKKFINFSDPMSFIVGILEIVSEFSKIISFAFRLFGNIFAGEVLIAIIAFLIPIAATFPFLLLEIFVGLIQALVFSMLTTVFISIAIQKSH